MSVVAAVRAEPDKRLDEIAPPEFASHVACQLGYGSLKRVACLKMASVAKVCHQSCLHLDVKCCFCKV